MVLSDRGIRAALVSGDLQVDPFDDRMIQPASLDVRLGEDFLTGTHLARTDQEEQVLWHKGRAIDGVIRLPRNTLILAQTLERVTLGRDLMARLCGKSSFGRKGVMVHVTAGVVDPGWDGVLTLELYNVGPAPVSLVVGEAVAQLVIERMDDEAAVPYRGRYQGANGVEASR